jgi:hypothetical protein
MTPRPAHCERGLTLTELTIVAAIASLVMLGLVGFYISSQQVWMDASTQAITQREASSVVEAIAQRVHGAARAEVIVGPTGNCHLDLYDYGSSNPDWSFWWDEADSLILEGPNPASGKAIETSKVERFEVDRTTRAVELTLLRLRSAEGEPVEMSSTIAFQNRVGP